MYLSLMYEGMCHTSVSMLLSPKWLIKFQLLEYSCASLHCIPYLVPSSRGMECIGFWNMLPVINFMRVTWCPFTIKNNIIFMRGLLCEE